MVPENWLWVHITLLVTGLMCLIMAVASALMYLLQSAQIKSKHLGKVFLRLPSLDTLDRLHFYYLSAGVIFFSLGLVSGIFWARDLKRIEQIFSDPMAILSFITCVLYWVILSLRASSIRRGQKIAAGTVFASFLLLVTLLSSTFVPSGFHKGLN